MDGLEFPKLVLIDLSSACNATCIMCPTQLSPLRKKIMEPALFEKIAAQVAQLPELDWFFIGVHGEPLLDKNLHRKVQFCKEIGLAPKVYITTNGSLLDDRRSRELLSADPGVVIFSIESIHAETYESIRKGLTHSTVVENLKTFLRVRNELDAKTRVGVRFIESSTNRAEKEQYMAYWAPFIDTPGRGDFFSLDAIHNWGYGDSGVFHGSTPCAHSRMLTVLSDGAAVFCCIDHDGTYQLGDAHTQTLVEIFNGAKAREMRHIQQSGQRHTLKMCSTCDLPEAWAGKPLGLYDDFVAADWVAPPAPKGTQQVAFLPPPMTA